LALNVVVIGSTSTQLKEMLEGCGVAATLAGTHSIDRLPDAVVLDLRNQTEIPATFLMLKRQYPSFPVVVVASKLDPALMLDAMRAGANEWVTEPVSAKDLQAALARTLSQRVGVANGRVIAVLGAKGGMGATTVAVNLASALTKHAPTAAERRGGASSLLIDFNLACGDAAIFLGAEPRLSTVDALENMHRMDEAFLRSLVVRTKSGPDLLGSSDRTPSFPVDGQRIRALIDLAASNYAYVVLDIARSDTAVLDSLDAASMVVVVTSQELPAVKNAGRLSAMLRQRYGKGKVVVVLNRYSQSAEIGREDVERIVVDQVRLLPSDYALAVEAVNKGRPFVMDNTGKLAASFESLARELSGAAPRIAPAESKAGLFGKLTARRA
jgi:pilus assembly protein CpaE